MIENPSPFGSEEQANEDSRTSSSDPEALISDVQPSMTFKQAFGPWLESRGGFISDRTYRDYNASKKPLFKFFGSIPLEAITAGQIRQYQAWRLRTCGSPSINHECSILQQMLKRVRVWAKIADDYQPIPIPRVGPGKALTEEEEARWFAAAAIKPGWRVAYLASLLSVNTSAGPSEILGLKLEHVRLNESPPEMQIIAGTKNRYRIRHVPLNDKARWAVEQLVARARELGATEPAHYLVPFRICKGSYDPLRHTLSWKSAHIEICATANIQMRNLDVAKVLDVSPSARGKMGGIGELDLQLLGGLSDAWKKTLSGTGKFAVRNGHLPGVNLSAAAQSVAKLGGVGGDTPFTVLEGDINIKDQRVSSKQIHLDSPSGTVDLRGSVGLDGSLDYQGQVVVNPGAVAGTGMVGSIVGGLLSSRVSKITVPIALGGTIESPKVQPGKGVPSFAAPASASGTAPSSAPASQPPAPENPVDTIKNLFKKH